MPPQEVSDRSRALQVKLRWFHYLFAAGMSYLIPCLAMLLVWPTNDRRGLLLVTSEPWLFMLLPAGLTFGVLFPFLRAPVQRRIALVCVCVGWMLVIGLLIPTKCRFL